MMILAGQTIGQRYQLRQQLSKTATGRQTWLARALETQESGVMKFLAFNPEIEWEEVKL